MVLVRLTSSHSNGPATIAEARNQILGISRNSRHAEKSQDKLIADSNNKNALPENRSRSRSPSPPVDPDLSGTLLVLYDDLVLGHRVQEYVANTLMDAMECPERILSIKASLAPLPFLTVRPIGCPPPTTHTLADTIISTSHNPAYIRHLRTIWSDFTTHGFLNPDACILPECYPHPQLLSPSLPVRPHEPKNLWARHGFWSFDMSTGVGAGTWSAIRASANLAVTAAVETVNAENARAAARARGFLAGRGQVDVEAVVGPKYTKTVLALCRPPGHHCTTELAGGYCYVNNLVIAERTLSFLKGRSVRCAVLDLDFHHGNGTQSFYYGSADVLYVSIHGKDEYPYYTGSEKETGTGEGEGYNFNLPLNVDSTPEQYLEKLRVGLDRISEFRPEYVLVSLGFDTYKGDPLGSFLLETSDYEIIARTARSSKGFCNIPAVIVLEGGYVVEAIGDNMASFMKGWTDAEKSTL